SRVHGRGRDGMSRRLPGARGGAARPTIRAAVRPVPDRAPGSRLALPPRRALAPVVVARVAIVGTGLIGASVGLAAARGGAVVTGWDPDAAALTAAVERGAVGAAGSLEEALAGAELAVVAAPIAALPAEVAAVLTATGEETTVTDVGSTKASV